MRKTTRKLNYRNRTELSLADISRLYNPILRGWLEYYGRFSPSALHPVLRHFNKTLVAWAMRKYRRLKNHKTEVDVDEYTDILGEAVAARNGWKRILERCSSRPRKG